MTISVIKIEERNRAAIIKYSEAMSELYRMIQSKSVDFPALFKKHTLPPVISKKFLQKIGIIHITPTGRIKWVYDELPGTSVGKYIFDKIFDIKVVPATNIKIISKSITPKRLTPRYIRVKKEVISMMNTAEQEYDRLNMLDIHDSVNMHQYQ